MWFHLGPNQHQRERVFIATMTAKALNLKGQGGGLLTLSTADSANDAIGTLDAALTRINKQRANLGAYFNRLEHAAKGLMNAYENTQASESRIRDADMAEETVAFTKNQILVQSGTAMLAQANVRPQGVLSLLR
jgi:flagellin